MNLELEGKVVAITGGASGIGRASALGAAREGAKVALIDRTDAKAVAEDIVDLGGDAMALGCDIRDTATVDATMAQVVERFGGMDVLVNCAGASGPDRKPVSDTSDAYWELVVDTNLRGTFACTRAALPSLRERRGCIINIASELGLVGTAGLVVYGATKAGVINFTRGLAVEEGEYGVRVNCVCPGPVDTPFVNRSPDAPRQNPASSTIMGRMGEAEEIANVILFLASPRASYMTGSIVVADGGVTAHD
jgi:NAD(P)-dependent dehydrogenase (short-subunit alcohol dehydrogenase family)